MKLIIAQASAFADQNLCCAIFIDFNIFRWIPLVTDEESYGCIADSKAIQAATNSYAVRNLLLHINREKYVKVLDPPQNNQMRFGFYKSAHLFIGKGENTGLLMLN